MGHLQTFRLRLISMLSDILYMESVVVTVVVVDHKALYNLSWTLVLKRE